MFHLIQYYDLYFSAASQSIQIKICLLLNSDDVRCMGLKELDSNLKDVLYRAPCCKIIFEFEFGKNSLFDLPYSKDIHRVRPD